MTAAPGIAGRAADALWRRPGLTLALILGLPLLWLVVVYLGSLGALLLNAFYTIDPFSGRVVPEITGATWADLLRPQHLDIIGRSLLMAIAVTLAAALIAFPIAYYAARYARGAWRAVFYLGVTLPLWSSYLVKVYAWKLILAEEGIIGWAFARLGLMPLLQWWLSLPVVGGNSLSVSYTGTFLVFVYAWLPFMILPIQAAIERIPPSLLEAAGDLGATPGQTFARVIWPLALPGVIAGSIFTFSLTLGDYIIPRIVGTSARFLGSAVYEYALLANHPPLAAAFSAVPIAIMIVYLAIARRLGAFNAL